MSRQTYKEAPHNALPGNLAEVALIDAATCAAAGDMSVSWWHERVRAGRAPAPAVRMPRCTRWRLAEVAAFWREFVSADADPETRERLNRASQEGEPRRSGTERGREGSSHAHCKHRRSRRSGGASVKPDTGQAPAHKDEAPGMQAERSEGQGTTDNTDSAATAEHLQGDASVVKAFENLRATLGLNHGVCLYRLDDGSFLASKWNLSRPLADLRAVAIFARQLTGAM